MNIIKSDFMVKGYKNENWYFITKNRNNNYNVYQLFCETNKNTTVSDIKKILFDFKDLPEEEIIVSFPTEKYNAFLLFRNINIYKMNGFRLTLTDEEIVS